MRQPHLVGGFLAVGFVLVVRTGSAQTLPSIDARTWTPSTDPNAGLVLEPVATPGPWAFSVGAWLDYTHRPLTVRFAGTDQVAGRPVANLLGADITAQLGLGKIAAIGVSVPTILYQEGSEHLAEGVVTGGGVPQSSIGDVAIVGKATILSNERERQQHGIGLAALGALTLPTGERTSFVGEGSVTASLRVLAEYAYGRGENGYIARVHASLGYKLRTDHHAWPDASIGGVTFGDEIPWTFGVTIRPKLFWTWGDQGDRQVWELALHGALPAGPVGPFGTGDPGSARLSPVLLATSDRIALGHYRDVYVTIGADFGLDTAVGVPVVRGIVGVGWAPREHDKDHDGVPDDLDQCDELPEDRDGIQDEDGCPEDDADGDGFLDQEDACPLVPGLFWNDPKKNGCPGPDRDGDGIPDPIDACPDVKGVRSADPTKNGCPPMDPARFKDTDEDGVPDAHDACPAVKGEPNNDITKHGCPKADRDGDGVPDEVDACPDEKGEPSADPTRNGCPNLDHDGDTYTDDVDACPTQPEIFNGIKDDDGCPDQGGAPLVTIDAADPKLPVVLAKPLVFAQRTGRPGQDAELDAASVMTLRALATELSKHREWKIAVGVNPALAPGEADRRAQAIARKIAELTFRKDEAEVVSWDAVKGAAGDRSGIAFRVVLRVPPAQTGGPR